jgi:hypothetical protein
VGTGVAGNMDPIDLSTDRQNVNNMSSLYSDATGSREMLAFSPTQHLSSDDVSAQEQAPKR